MAGFCAPYVPGYDTHGLPIELKALGSLGNKKADVSKLELRRICREFATEHIDIMNEQFQRLGVQGDFGNPYLTLRPEFEARQVEIFGKMAEKGLYLQGPPGCLLVPGGPDRPGRGRDRIRRGCLRFDLCPLQAHGRPQRRAGQGRYPRLKTPTSVIWTTTTWTLPANVATCLHPDFDYTFVKIGNDYHLMAAERIKPAMEACGITDYTVCDVRIPGRDLELVEYQHPFLDRKGLFDPWQPCHARKWHRLRAHRARPRRGRLQRLPALPAAAVCHAG